MTDPGDATPPGDEPRLVVVSNRLPVRLISEGGTLRARPGAGGLVSALTPVLRERGGLWLGWSGVADPGEGAGQVALKKAGAELGFELHGVPLDPEEISLYYEGFSNSIIWPLFHDRVGDCDFDGRYWEACQRVVQRFADSLLPRTRPADTVWVHDYHLFHLGTRLRLARPRQRMGFFLHIPFPPPDILIRLPWWEDVLRALFTYDSVGLQTRRDLRNLAGAVGRLPDVKVRGQGSDFLELSDESRQTRVEVQPIGIDARDWSRQARSPGVDDAVRTLREGLGGARMVLGVDRLDYTKGLLERLDAWELMLERHPELRGGKVVLVQVVVPSREGVARYQELKADLERRVGAISGRFGEADGSPVRYLYRSIPRDELIALYRAADVCLVTSLKDGMNLVAKEYVACQVGAPGALVLSRFAGAAAQLGQGALLVNPHDTAATARALALALALPEAERTRRMQALQKAVRAQDVHWWVDRCLSSLREQARVVKAAG